MVCKVGAHGIIGLQDAQMLAALLHGRGFGVPMHLLARIGLHRVQHRASNASVAQ